MHAMSNCLHKLSSEMTCWRARDGTNARVATKAVLQET